MSKNPPAAALSIALVVHDSSGACVFRYTTTSSCPLSAASCMGTARLASVYLCGACSCRCWTMSKAPAAMASDMALLTKPSPLAVKYLTESMSPAAQACTSV